MSIFNTLGLGFGVSLVNNFSAPATRIVASMRTLTDEGERMHRANLRYIRDTSAAGAVLGGAAILGMSRWVAVGSEFGYTMAAVKAAAEATNTEFKALDKTARNLGKQTMFSSRDVASGMKYMAMAGQTAQDINQNIKAATALAGATQTEIGGKGGAADILTNVMMAFGAAPTESMRYADVLTQATIKANTDLLDLGEALKYSSSTIRTMGFSVEDATSMAMVLGNAGIQGSMAGTAIENMVRYITRASGEARTNRQGEALAKLGLSPQSLMDSKGNLLGMRDILKVMSAQLETMGNVEQQNILNDIFGVRGNRAAALIIRNLKDIDKAYNEVAFRSDGRSMSVMNDMMQTLHGNLDQVVSGFEDLKITFTKGIEPVLKPTLRLIGGFLNALVTVLDTPFIGPFISTAVGGFLLIKTAALALRAAVSGIAAVYRGSNAVFVSMKASNIMGWQDMTRAAQSYAMAARGAWMSTGATQGYGRAGGPRSGYAANIPHGWQGGMFAGVVGMNAVGQYLRRSPNGRIGRFLNTELGDRYMRRFGSRVTGSAFSRGLASVGIPVLGRVMPILSRVLGFLGGPLGMFLMFALPALFSGLSSALGDNTEQLEENTEALDIEKAGRLKANWDERMQNLNRAWDLTTERRYDVNNAVGERLLETLVSRLEKRGDTNLLNNVSVYIDQKEQLKRALVEEKVNELFKSGI